MTIAPLPLRNRSRCGRIVEASAMIIGRLHCLGRICHAKSVTPHVFENLGSRLGHRPGAPYIVPASVFGANAPSNRITVGFIGNGNQSTLDLPAFLEKDDVQVVAVCDVNTASYGYKTPDQFLGRKPAQDKVNAHYAAKQASGQYKGCDAYHDFREVLARADIDAVAIVVPDHWHGLMVVNAAKAGKDMYCEKPLSLTVRQGQAMVKAVREHKRILQTGSHYRSSPANRFACELVRNGRIGQVKRILTQVAENNAVSPGPGWQPMPVPEGFDYEMWLGPAPQAPYHSIAACIASVSCWTTPAAKRPTSVRTRTTSPNGAWARTTPGRSRSKIREASGLRRAACSPRRPR